MEDKTISAMPQVEQLDGSELVPVVQEGQNRKATMAQIVDKAQEDVVMKESGKGLSTNDYTDTDKAAVATIANKVDKVSGKGLSTNDYTNEEKAKLANLPSGAVLTESLNSKLDKSVWDTKNKQFCNIGHYIFAANGEFNVAYDKWHCNTGLIAINRDSDIMVHGGNQMNTAAIAFYDVNAKFISAVPWTGAEEETITVLKEDIPKEAVWVRSCSSVDRHPSYSNGPEFESRENAMAEAVAESAKLALFVKLWTRCYDCQYDGTKEKPFTCNGVELTYDEAVDVYNAPRFCQNDAGRFTTLANWPKTIILGVERAIGNQYCLFDTFRTFTLEVIRISADERVTYVTNIRNAFYGDYKLKRILGIIGFTSYQENDMTKAFNGCSALEDVSIYQLRKDVSFADCPNLSAESLLFMVRNRQGKGPLTITVHPTVYAKLTASREGLDNYLPANLLVNSQEATTPALPNTGYSYAILNIGLGTFGTVGAGVYTESQEKFTLSVGSIENLAGEPTAYDVIGYNKGPNADWSSGSEITAENKSTIITAIKNLAVGTVFLYAGKRGHTQGNRVKFKNIKMEFGENPNPKWTPAISEIADEEIRERVMWATIADIAAHRNISFATTE